MCLEERDVEVVEDGCGVIVAGLAGTWWPR
jgi:hypothetical protein